MSAAGIILAGGSSERMGVNKLLLPINGKNAIERCVETFSRSPDIDGLILVASKDTKDECDRLARGCEKPCTVVMGGAERPDSVRNGLLAAVAYDIAAIHDGARCFVTQDVIKASIDSAEKYGSGVAAVRAKDTIKRATDGVVRQTLDRSELYVIQTPQTFVCAAVLDAYERAAAAKLTATDDAALLEAQGHQVRLVEGSYENIKLTTPDDMELARTIAAKREGNQAVRIGYGEDVHRLVPNRRLVIGGVEFKHDTGLLGHSDADVLAHAVADAILGAAALGDIGTHFPDTDNRYKDANSIELLRLAAALVRDAGWRIENVDATVVAEAPKLMPRAVEMRTRLAGALGVEPSAVSVKATTNEGLDAIGNGAAIAARAVALIRAR